MTPHGTPASGTPVRHGTGRHSVRGRRPGGTARRLALGALTLAVVLVVGVGTGMLLTARDEGASAAPDPQTDVSPAAGSSSTASTATTDLPGRMTMLSRVVGVESGDVVSVEVAYQVLSVRVLGLDAPDAATAGRPAECGSDAAIAFATETLRGQTVTLVPDPSLPETDEQGRRLSYVVMRSQLSYTDAALMAGVGRMDTSRPAMYSEVFAQEQQKAAAARKGIWGPPCLARPTP